MQPAYFFFTLLFKLKNPHQQIVAIICFNAASLLPAYLLTLLFKLKNPHQKIVAIICFNAASLLMI